MQYILYLDLNPDTGHPGHGVATGATGIYIGSTRYEDGAVHGARVGKLVL